MTENWKPVVGWEERYEVSNMGRVRRTLSFHHSRKGGSPSRHLSGVLHNTGYRCVGLTNANGRTIVHNIAVLVLEAFVGPRPPWHQACHGNGVRDDNRVSNLRWDTVANNHLDKKVHGTWQAGENHGRSKLTDAAVREILTSKATGISLAEKFGVVPETIYRVRRGEAWAHANQRKANI